VDRAGAVEVVGIRVVVEHRKAPAVVAHVIDASEESGPIEVAARRGIEKILPLVPQELRVPVHAAARQASGEVEPEDRLVRVSRPARGAGGARGAALLADEGEYAEVERSGRNAHAAEKALAIVVVEHRVRTAEARAVDVEVVGDAVSVHRADGEVEVAD